MTVNVHDFAAMQAMQEQVRARLEAYEGNFDFLLAMKRYVADPAYIFTPRQVDAIIRCLDRERKSGPGNEPGTNDLAFPETFPKGSRYYAADKEDGGTVFLRIDHVEEGKWAGWFFVKVVQGPREEIRVGSQKPGSAYKGQWPEIIDQVIGDPLAAMQRYGREIGRCGFCGLRLTDSVSRALGIGPICRERFGL